MAITTEDFLVFCERTLDGMIRTIERLDDGTVNRAPPVAGASTPFQLVTHALGACHWWTSHIVCGHATDRVRDAEFRAAGTVAQAVDAATQAKHRLRSLAPELDAATELQNPALVQDPLDGAWTVGAALMHTYEELAQHLGHLEMAVDVLLSNGDGLPGEG